MADINSDQMNSIATFRALHDEGCFVLPNPWDAGSAVYLQHLGFKALATTSGGFAFTKGLPDEVWALSRDLMLEHFQDLAQATSLPVNGDFQNGYADDPETLAANVSLCIKTGVAGLSIEDATGDKAEPLYETSLAVERVKAARRAIDQSGIPVLLTARCEAWLVQRPDAQRVVLDRLTAFADAGADCLYAPGVSTEDQISEIVRAVSPRPVNVLAYRPSSVFTVSQLTDLGVRRISVGSSLARVAWGAFMNAAKSIKETGSFDSFANAGSYAELSAVFGKR